MRCLLHVVLLGLLCVLVTGSESRDSKKPPHIMILMVDEMDGRVMDPSSEYYEHVQLPNLRKLAAEGTNFVSAYSPSPQCVPARSVMLSGRRTDQLMVLNNGHCLANVTSENTLDSGCVGSYGEDWCENLATKQGIVSNYYDVLEGAGGYTTRLFGKAHTGAGFGNKEYPALDGAWGECWAGQNTAWVRAANIFKPCRDELSEVISGIAHMNVARPGVSQDYTTIEEAVSHLDNLSKDSGPVLLATSLLQPHPPYSTNATFLNMLVNASEIELPVWPAQDTLHPNDAHDVMSKGFWNASARLSKQQQHEFVEEYLAFCAQADTMLGRVMAAHKASVIGDEPTVWLFVADHGDLALSHQQVQKNSMKEGSSRVPMVLAGPGVRAGATVTHPVTLLDVFPTLLDIAGVQMPGPSFLSGHSLMPLASTGSDPKRPAYATSQYHSIHAVTGTFMVRWNDDDDEEEEEEAASSPGRQWKLITYAPLGLNGTNAGRFPNWPSQLFDLASDPAELNDVAADHPTVVAKLTEFLEEELGDWHAIDQAAKALDHDMFVNIYLPEQAKKGKGCKDVVDSIISRMDASDMADFEAWLGKPCT